MTRPRAAALGVMLAVSGLAAPGVASAAEPEAYDSFASTVGLTLGGTAEATPVDGVEVLRLTLDAKQESSYAFASQAVPIESFSTAFAFRLSDPGGEADPNGHVGGDGFTFAIQPLGAKLGGDLGSGLGISGVDPSVAVEFDTWDNDCAEYPSVCDPSSNHIGVDIDGDVHSVVTANVSPAMDNGKEWYAWIDYDGETLEIRLNETTARPTKPQLSHTVDLPKTLGITASEKAFVGFTASTGTSFQNQDILSWFYATPMLANGLAPVGPPAVKDAGPTTAEGFRLSGGAPTCNQAGPGADSYWPAGGALLALVLLARRRSASRVSGPFVGGRSRP
jgi:hypothetical protein